MKTLAFAYPGDLDTPTGGYGYARRIIAGLRDLDWNITPFSLGPGFPQPDTAAKAQALDILKAVPREMPLVIDGLAFGALAEEAEALCQSHRLIALVHHPLALETGLSAAQQYALQQSETRSLAAAHTVIVSSPATAEILLRDFGVPNDKIAVVIPGTDRVKVAPKKRSDDAAIRLVSVGSLVPRKGHVMLIDTLADLTDLPWRLDIAGDDQLDPEHAETLRAMIATHGLRERVTLHGALSPDALDALYAAGDIFVLATRFEGYGMAFTEATVRGLPIVATGSGAVKDTIAPGAGLLYDPRDKNGFCEGLRRMIIDTDFRAKCAAGARSASKSYPTWREAAMRFAAAIEAKP